MPRGHRGCTTIAGSSTTIAEDTAAAEVITKADGIAVGSPSSVAAIQATTLRIATSGLGRGQTRLSVRFWEEDVPQRGCTRNL